MKYHPPINGKKSCPLSFAVSPGEGRVDTGTHDWLRSPLKSAHPLLLLSHFSRVQLCDHTDCSLPGSSILRIFQARILECVAISFSKGP